MTSASRTFVDVHFKHLPFAGDLPTHALLAAVFRIDALALPIALRTHRLHLLNEAWSELLHADLDSGATTSRALLNSSGLTTTTYTRKQPTSVS